MQQVKKTVTCVHFSSSSNFTSTAVPLGSNLGLKNLRCIVLQHERHVQLQQRQLMMILSIINNTKVDAPKTVATVVEISKLLALPVSESLLVLLTLVLLKFDTAKEGKGSIQTNTVNN